MRVAIIGTGIAGMTTAHALHRLHDLTIYESQARYGGHTNTVQVDAPDGPFAVDTGFIVFNDVTYPNFTRLLEKIGVESQDSTMSFSVRCARTGLEYNGSSINQLFTQRVNAANPRFLRMLLDIVRFNSAATSAAIAGDIDPTLTLGEFIRQGGYGSWFKDRYILPMGAAIWSAPEQDMLAVPARFFIRFFHNHGMLKLKGRPQWKTIRGGSAEYAKKLIAPFADRIRLGARVHRVSRRGESVVVEAEGQEAALYDHVVISCHSDEALAMLGDPSQAEKEILGGIGFQANQAVLHSDERLLPRAKRAWAGWNYHLPSRKDHPATVTYNLTILQRLPTSTQYLVTLNSTEPIEPTRVIAKMIYHHPVFTVHATNCQARRAEISGTGRTHFCGAYWYNGFHEDGVRSALDVANWFGASL